MNSTKFNLYNAEWLDLVFDHRNKTYGAYELRQQYSRTMVKAMALAFAGVAILIVASIIFRHQPVPVDGMKTYALPDLPPPPREKTDQKKKIEKYVAPARPKQSNPTTKFVRPEVVPYDPPVDPPVISELKGAISNQTVNKPGDQTVDNIPEDILDGKGTGEKQNITEADDRVRPFTEIEVMPEPFGGAQAWAKFLQANLRYPALARENNIAGRVLLNFIVEKDGTLSNIKVSRGLGYGLDEESVRVLKLAKAWKPGIQNGHPVRVAYTIPFYFQLAQE